MLITPLRDSSTIASPFHETLLAPIMTTNQTGLEIAVIGLSGRFPRCQTIEEFWHHLATGSELVTPFSGDRSPQKNPPNTSTKAGAVLNHVDQFDAAFFGFNPREAEAMDPQHRLFLECAWEALENAGYSSEAEDRPIGVFAGVGMGTYLLYNLSPTPGFIESRGFLQTLIGVDKDYLPTRVSYKLNLKGPSISVGTACSSSLVAVHLACQSLLSGECDMALAAGVAIKVPQSELTLCPDEIASTDGHCRAFDSRANGTVGGNGIGIVVLKRLEDAIADRDYIYAVVKGSAINNDGAMKVGYTAPSETGQTTVIRAAQRMADVDPDTITYLETHGTGTVLGDPIEIAAMTQAFRATTDRTEFCAIGSVKTNVGHLDAAAGIAGFLKTVLALDRKQIPPSLHFESPNAQIDFANSPFYVNTQLTEWSSNGTPRRAGVSSFGFGGTNAHAILEEAPPALPKETEDEPRPYQLVALSAKTESALDTAMTNLRDRLQQSPELDLADVAHTLQVGRWAWNHRCILVAQTPEETVHRLTVGDVRTGWTDTSDRPVVFMFPGQGSQYVNMARELYEQESIFQEECDRCFALLQAEQGINLHQVLYPKTSDVSNATQQLTQTAITQPALFVIEYALAKLWMSWGVQPTSMIGHSIGEYVAACLANVFSLKDALTLVAVRGKLMQQQPPGAMLTVNLAITDLQPWLNEELSLAVSNSPLLNVVSGSVAAIETLSQQLSNQGIYVRPLRTSHAFHSPLIAGAIDPFIEQLHRVQLKPPQIPLISNVTGTWITDQEATDPFYWAKHLRQTVQFSQGIAELLKDPQVVFLEVGPGHTLTTLVQQQTSTAVGLTSLPHAQDHSSDEAWLLTTLGQLWLNGVSVNWQGFYARQQRRRIPLPTYPFERQRYWIDPPTTASLQPSQQAALDKKLDIADWFYVPSWQRSTAPLMHNHERSAHWIVFMDGSSLSNALVQQLHQQGYQVSRIKADAEFSQSPDHSYTINPTQPEDYDRLIQALTSDSQPLIIAHLWTIADHLSWEASQIQGFYSLLYLAQALERRASDQSIHLGVVSSHLQEVIGHEVIQPEKATVLGPCKVIPQEYANITCCNIDVIHPGSDYQAQNQLVEQIIQELLHQAIQLSDQSSDTVVAYRGNYRWLPTYEAMRLETVEQSPVRSQGVYLITGGLGGIGLTLAEHLAQTVQARLVLVSRSSMPPQDEWNAWLSTHAEQDFTSAKIRRIQALEAIGSQVLILKADVTDQAQMQAVVDQAQQTFGAIHGVFHVAGVAGGGVISLKTSDVAAQVMAPKVKGTHVLSQVLQHTPLDFWVLFSSISAVVGGAGQVDYCAANCFLDAFADSQSAQPVGRIISINWDTWQEVGMSANTVGLPDALKTQRLVALKTGLSGQEGWDGLTRILQSRCHRVIVSTKDWSAVLAQKHDWTVSPDQPQASSAVSSGHQRSLQSTPYVSPRNNLEQEIAALWCEQLGIAAVGVNDNFFELGGHSLLAVRVVSRLRDLYPIELSLRTFLSEAPTIAGIAAVIAEQLPQSSNTDDMSRILAEIEHLSLEEVQSQLAQKSQVN